MAKNKAESVKQRLLALARTRKEDFNFVLRQFVLQRLMYRLSVSKFSGDFLLKGGLLFWVWNQDFNRPTQDMDLLGFGSDDVELLQATFLAITQIEADDGLVFNGDTLTVTEIKEDAKYQGIRVNGRATLVKADIPYQIDIAFDDAVAAVSTTTKIPVFLSDMPVPEMKVYPLEAVISEKFQAMVALGLANSRMKDFFDVLTLAQTMSLDSNKLQAAIKATFERRATPINRDRLYIFSGAFKTNSDKQKQ
ncbi:nucleotidyl transferase AbiEii/AbiGii toxin family protein [Dasania marina]|uniref:nucleotidyl transferase AbiEii/AbiGii toxin family protein n=1 Tax=Dasania marina TaxID=471499 RepID=UPI0030DC246D|tara:strand:+ start:60679 stop:61428 length:750 start_codon:yes stop_codon:yes gene_type:complete